MTALILVALAVAVDSFAVAMAFGLAGAGQRSRLEIAMVFGLFEGGMPLLGLELGSRLSSALGGSARPAGAALLCLTGIYGLASDLIPRRGDRYGRRGDGHGPRGRPRPWRLRLWIAGIAVSVDNLVVGLALGTYHVPLVAALCTFALAGAGLSLLGVEFGHRAAGLLARLPHRRAVRAGRFGNLSEALAGATLIAVGLGLALR